MCELLRGETLFRAELSDVFQVLVQKEDDPHPLFVMIMQFATGKVNCGLKLCGRVARKKNSLLGTLSVRGHVFCVRKK